MEIVIKAIIAVWGLPFLLMLFLMGGYYLWELWDGRVKW